MNREPVSISTLMTPVSTPRAAKAPLHADRAVAIGQREAFDLSSDVRTTRSGRDQVEPQQTCGTEPVRSAAGGVELAFIPDHTRPIPTGPCPGCRRDVVATNTRFHCLPHRGGLASVTSPTPEVNGIGSHPLPGWPR